MFRTELAIIFVLSSSELPGKTITVCIKQHIEWYKMKTFSNWIQSTEFNPKWNVANELQLHEHILLQFQSIQAGLHLNI